MSLVRLVLLGLLCHAEAARRDLQKKETAGVWDETSDPEAYYEDEDFFGDKVPAVLPPSALMMSGPVGKTFFLEKQVELKSPRGSETWMEARFADRSTVKLLQARGPKASSRKPQQTRKPRLKTTKGILGPAKDFRFKSTHEAGLKHKVMPPVGGITWNGPSMEPCPNFGVSNIYYGLNVAGPNYYPDRPCGNVDYEQPYYAKPVRPLMPELQVGLQSPAMNFFSDGQRYPRNMEMWDHWAAQGPDTYLSPNSPHEEAAGGKGKGGKKGKRRR